jgi:hypothetical protein
LTLDYQEHLALAVSHQLLSNFSCNNNYSV